MNHTNATYIQPSDEVNLHLKQISMVLVEPSTVSMMERRMEIGNDCMTMGMRNVSSSQYITLDSEEEQSSDDDAYIDHNKYFVSGIKATTPHGVDATHLSKVWQISHDDAKWTLQVTTQHSLWPTDPTLAENYGMNDQMLWYKCMKDYFYMNIFFMAKKGGKSS